MGMSMTTESMLTNLARAYVYLYQYREGGLTESEMKMLQALMTMRDEDRDFRTVIAEIVPAVAD
jgi:hypothetical protein